MTNFRSTLAPQVCFSAALYGSSEASIPGWVGNPSKLKGNSTDSKRCDQTTFPCGISGTENIGRIKSAGSAYPLATSDSEGMEDDTAQPLGYAVWLWGVGFAPRACRLLKSRKSFEEGSLTNRQIGHSTCFAGPALPSKDISGGMSARLQIKQRSSIKREK